MAPEFPRAPTMAASDIETMVSPTESVTRVLPMVWERVAARFVPVSPSGTGKYVDPVQVILVVDDLPGAGIEGVKDSSSVE